MKWARKDAVFNLSGPINEHAEGELEALEAALAQEPRPILDLAQTTHVNSLGLTHWHRFFQRLEAKQRTPELRRVPMPLVRFVNMLGDASRLRAAVASVLAPFLCDACGKEFEAVLPRAALAAAEGHVAVECTACGHAAQAEIDDDLLVFAGTVS
jgi:ABC-type transporter Mla MlaB component